ncbi:MAG: helix-turn-helix transcriptional regulator [Acidobacteriia bacterium]|nr:helix-turn-helix transcriptional regulator [Terriglobia bacterium]
MLTRDEKNRTALLQGTLDLLILRILVFGPQHGQGVARAIQEQSEDVLLVDHGALYPALQRLEAQGWPLAQTRRRDRARAGPGSPGGMSHVWPQTSAVRLLSGTRSSSRPRNRPSSRARAERRRCRRASAAY